MEKTESSCSILRSLNLNNIEEVVSEAYHQEGAGRPPRKPIGIFKALIVKRVSRFQATENYIDGYGMIKICERSAILKLNRSHIIPRR